MNVLRHMLLGLMAAVMVLTSGTMALARTSPGGQAPNGQTIVICTGMGLSTVTLDANGNPVDPSPICPDCALHSVALLDAHPRMAGPASTLTVLQPAAPPQTGPSFEVVQAAARGPPLAV